MCGIFGCWQFGRDPVDLAGLQAATNRIRHRGPDDEGYLLVDTRAGTHALAGGDETTPELALPPLGSLGNHTHDLAFGFRRLSILDLSPAGHQPMASHDGSCWLIFNGEIYNYLELREELARHGHEFRTGTDTEVILAAYQEWGPDCVKRFTGMWALAVWDAARKRLFLSRDPFGIKPLYYAADNERLVFASEIKSLLAYTRAPRRASPARLYEYLRSGLTDYGDGTLFEGVGQLPAAHYLVVEAGREARPARYWQIDFGRELDISFEEAAARLRELFLTSVRLHLRSDVRVGAALSGGIDSSSIVASMRAVEPRLEVHAFSYAAEDPAISEERWIDLVGESARAVVHKVRPTPEELVADLDRLIEAQDEPFGSTSIYAQHRVFRLARESGVTVMLDGQGADELLAGYRVYLAMRLASLLRRGRLVAANRFMRASAALPENNGLRGLNLLANAGGALLPGRLRLLRGLVKRSLGHEGAGDTWLDESWFFERGVVPRAAVRPRTRLMLQEHLYETLSESSIPALLRYEDRNSMAHSIESRVPFLTTALAEFVLSLPEEHLLAPDGTSKSVFRRAMRGLVPDAILDRRDKIGFATPEGRWMTTLRPWVEGVLASDAARRIPGLNMEVVREQWEAMLAGTRPFDFRVWRWLNVVRWAEKYEVGF